MAQGQGQGAVAAHGVAHDRLARRIHGEVFGDQGRQLFGHIAPHPVVLCERLLRGVHIEPGAESEVIGASRIARHTVAARAGVGRDEDQAQLGAGAPKLAFLGDVGMGAGEAGQIPDHGQLDAIAHLRRQIDREGHSRRRRAACMLVDALRAAMRPIERHGIDGHEL